MRTTLTWGLGFSIRTYDMGAPARTALALPFRLCQPRSRVPHASELRTRPLNRRPGCADSSCVRLRLLILALVAQLVSGCFVFDEIDKGNKLMEQNSGVQQKKKAEEAAAAQAAATKTGNAAEGEKKKGWWETARSISAADKAPTDDPHVRCDIEGKERFMVQSDCVTQGGRPL
jgi:hypothetical protein